LVRPPFSPAFQCLERATNPVREDKLGTGFTPVRMDINGNIERLNKRYEASPEKYSDLFTILEEEVGQNCHTDNSSCTKGLLWLKRAMQFVVCLLRLLQADESASLSSAANQAYNEVLQPYHGWITTGIFTVALKIVPSREDFYQNLGTSEKFGEEMNAFIEQFDVVLSKIHAHLDSKGLNFPDKV